MEYKDFSEFENEDEAWEYLIATGSMYLGDLDENNEPLFYVDMNVCKIYAPWYLEVHLKELDKTLISLYEKGILEIDDIDPQEGVTWKLSEDARQQFN